MLTWFSVVSSATGGFATRLLSGVSNVLNGLSAGTHGPTPGCKNNFQLCNSEFQGARDGVIANQPEAKDACLQARYSCGQFYNSNQINKMIPGCAQYDSA